MVSRFFCRRCVCDCLGPVEMLVVMAWQASTTVSLQWSSSLAIAVKRLEGRLCFLRELMINGLQVERGVFHRQFAPTCGFSSLELQSLSVSESSGDVACSAVGCSATTMVALAAFCFSNQISYLPL